MLGLKDDCAGMQFAFEAALPEEKDAATIQREKKSRMVCKNYKTGTCHLGTECPDRHIQTTAKSVHQEVCRHWLRGACVNGENCLYLHEYLDRLVPECTYFAQFGECTNPECFYRHVHPDDRKPKCAAYERGFCPSGPDCIFRHVKKAAPCPNFMLGFCPLGDACKLGHPADKVYDHRTVSKRISARMAQERAGDPSYSSRFTCHTCLDPGHKADACPGIPNGQMFRVLSAIHEPGERRVFLSNGRRPRDEDGLQQCHRCWETGHQSKDCPAGRPRYNNHGPR